MSALAQMYAPDKNTHTMDVWYFDMNKFDLPVYVEGREPVYDEKNFMRYEAPLENSVVITYKPEEKQCLWVLTGRDANNLYLSKNERYLLPLSNPGQILRESGRPLRAPLRVDIFGLPPEPDWCAYYEYAELARQYGDWDAVIAYWKAAQEEGFGPRVGVEYAPFIEAFARRGDYEQALALTRAVFITEDFFPNYQMKPYLCALWQDLGAGALASPDGQQAVSDARDVLECRSSP